jgi:hypothetical protein
METLAKYLGKADRILKKELHEEFWFQAQILSIKVLSNGNHIGLELIEVSEGKENLALSSARIWNTNREEVLEKFLMLTGEKYPIGSVLNFKVECAINYQHGFQVVIRDCAKTNL